MQGESGPGEDTLAEEENTREESGSPRTQRDFWEAALRSALVTPVEKSN